MACPTIGLSLGRRRAQTSCILSARTSSSFWVVATGFQRYWLPTLQLAALASICPLYGERASQARRVVRRPTRPSRNLARVGRRLDELEDHRSSGRWRFTSRAISKSRKLNPKPCSAARVIRTLLRCVTPWNWTRSSRRLRARTTRRGRSHAALAAASSLRFYHGIQRGVDTGYETWARHRPE